MTAAWLPSLSSQFDNFPTSPIGLPTFILKQIVDLALVAAAGHFPVWFNETFITPIVKKPRLDSAELMLVHTG